MKKTIRKIHTEKIGKVSDKWDSYLDFYDEKLFFIRDQSISLLEIGVQNGGSLETWAEYFENAKVLIGCDIDPNCKKLEYIDQRVNVVIGDANRQETFAKINEIENSFRLIIDDGSHQSIDIINSFINYFPLIEPGGIYIIEDACCLYMKDFGGGVFNENSAQYFFKKLTDVISYQWWESDASLNTYLQTFFPNGNLPSFIIDGWIESIEFRNSIISIQKSRNSGHSKLGKRIISGVEKLVQNWGGEIPT